MANEKKEYTNEEKANYWTREIHNACAKAVEAETAYEILHWVRIAYIKGKRLERLLSKGEFIIEE